MALYSQLEGGDGRALFERMNTHGYAKSYLPYYTIETDSARGFLKGIGTVLNGPPFTGGGFENMVERIVATRRGSGCGDVIHLADRPGISV